MGNNQGAYSPAELDAIAGWLADGLSASRIADELSQIRRCVVSRNAIIGVVHRNARLAAIGFERQHGSTIGAPAKAPANKPVRLHPGDIRGKKESRAFARPFAVPLRIVDDVLPHIYDATSLHLPLEDLAHGQCRWPVNNAPQGGQHLFCGQVSAEDRSYCPHHGRRAVGSGTTAERQAPRQLLRLTA